MASVDASKSSATISGQFVAAEAGAMQTIVREPTSYGCSDCGLVARPSADEMHKYRRKVALLTTSL